MGKYAWHAIAVALVGLSLAAFAYVTIEHVTDTLTRMQVRMEVQQ